MATTIIDADRISQLPDHIIHHILSFLPTPEVVRLSVLSKAWNGFFNGFPLSDFSDFSFLSTTSDRKLKFANFVYSSLLRQCLQSKQIPKLQLSFFGDSYECQSSDLINQSIRLSIEYGVKELSFYFFDSNYYILHEAIFSLRELVAFRLTGSSLKSTINWPSLREFCLKYVYISDQSIIDNLIFTCPLIEKFALIDCEGIGYLKLLGLTKLTKVIQASKSGCVPEKIEIDSLSLHTFFYASDAWSNTKVNFSLTACNNLKVLKFFGRGNITDETIECLISYFPSLKVLDLHDCVSRRIEISSLQLQRLELYTESKVVAIVINAPRLQSLEHEFRQLPSVFTIKKASLREVSIRLYPRHLYCQHHIDFLQYLMQYLRNFNQIKLLTLNISDWESCAIHQIFRNISDPFFLDINHLKVEIDAIEMRDHLIAEEGYEALVDCLFWIRHPESLELSRWGTNDECIKVLRKKLINYRVKDHHYCCADNKVKCWKHDLKDIKIEHYEEYGDREVVTCNAFLDPLNPVELKENIRLIFEW